MPSGSDCVRRPVEDAALRNLQLENLRKAIAELDVQGQNLLSLRYSDALTTDEIGQIYVWGDRIFEKCGIRRDEGGDGGKTLEIRGKRRLSARDGGANYQQS